MVLRGVRRGPRRGTEAQQGDGGEGDATGAEKPRAQCAHLLSRTGSGEEGAAEKTRAQERRHGRREATRPRRGDPGGRSEAPARTTMPTRGAARRPWPRALRVPPHGAWGGTRCGGRCVTRPAGGWPAARGAGSPRRAGRRGRRRGTAVHAQAVYVGWLCGPRTAFAAGCVLQ